MVLLTILQGIRDSSILIFMFICSVSETLKGCLFPPLLSKEVNFSSGLAAIKRQQSARIAKLAIYIFTVLATTTSIVLLESSFIPIMVAWPIASITLIFWMIFARLNHLEEVYIKGLNDQVLQELAKARLKELLCMRTLDTFANSASLIAEFEEINKLLNGDVLSKAFLQDIVKIKEQSSQSKTLFATSQELGISLALANKFQKYEKRLFGYLPIERKLEIFWDGKDENAIVISLETKSPQYGKATTK